MDPRAFVDTLEEKNSLCWASNLGLEPLAKWLRKNPKRINGFSEHGVSWGLIKTGIH